MSSSLFPGNTHFEVILKIDIRRFKGEVSSRCSYVILQIYYAAMIKVSI